MAFHEIDIWDRALQRLGDREIFPDLESSIVVTASVPSSPVVLTTAAQTWSTNDLIFIRDMDEHTELNGRVFRVTVVNATTVYLQNEEQGDSTSETTGGLAYKLPNNVIAAACYDAWSDIRDEVLAEHPWNRCVKRTRLARKEAAKNFTGAATKANPVVVTIGTHGYSNGDWVLISSVVGMTELNDRWFQVANKDADTFELSSEDGTDYTTYASGGNATKAHDAPFKSDDNQYSYRYTVPFDTIRILGLVGSKSDWDVEEDKVLTNDGIVVPIRYIFRNTDVSTYAPTLASAMSARLEAELTMLLTPDRRKDEAAMLKYERKLARSKVANGREASGKALAEDDWLIARDGHLGVWR